MLALLLAALCSAALPVCFRLIERWRVRIAEAIAANYGVCLVVGAIVSLGEARDGGIWSYPHWLVSAIVVGLGFYLMFVLMSKCSNRFGVTITSVANKMSLVIPVSLSLFLLRADDAKMEYLDYIGIGLAIPGLLLSIWRDSDRRGVRPEFAWLWLPLGIFVGNGLLDALINYAGLVYGASEEAHRFSLTVFGCAGVAGACALVIERRRISWRGLACGILLGVPNYFALYFLLMALAAFNNNGAIVYPMVNIMVILISLTVDRLIFGVRQSSKNLVGIGVCIAALLLLMCHI